MHKRGLCYGAVSVRMSVTFVYCLETAKHVLKLFSPSGSATVQFFRRKHFGEILTEYP